MFFSPLSEAPSGKEACAQIACAPITAGAFSVPCIHWNVKCTLVIPLINMNVKKYLQDIEYILS